ncbi:PCYCGC motif-containing (lipo)protein [Paenibacillus sp.]|uniref:PCYCGC motif-containing (lipo)protein n=1 Tax=Paenibacillus sp. TaxID=58172 RepID=UPI002D3F3B96|nr:PCYCGC motif-containing (lipo)protein [Paenibacillus sp.]HZG84577.1 PCYCGC motif-containing (lipo)protein [Paenibacillus sp.]
MKTFGRHAILFASLLAVAGCGAAGDGGAGHAGEHADAHHTANGDLRETTASLTALPSFLDEQPEAVRNAYLIAAMSADTLDFIPCYCGCGESAGHLSNKNCFISEIRDDGSVEWDDHGTRCGVCLQIAVEAAAMKKDGASLQDIREAIDAKYKDVGPATPTPQPPAA